jgi:mono/diheme cytochrome c family protein
MAWEGKHDPESAREEFMRLVDCLTGVLFAACIAAGPAKAAGKSMVLAADERLEASGLLKYIVPRFSLKNGIRVQVRTAVSGDLAEVVQGGDALLGPIAVAESLRQGGRGQGLRPAFSVDGDAGKEIYAVMLLKNAENPENAAAFLDWLTSEIGQRTIVSYSRPGQPGYLPGALKVEREVVELPEGDLNEGEKLAHLHCGRCHVISDRNRFGGIGSTPSFPALRAVPGWKDKFISFWASNPHPSFTRIIDVTPPFDPDRPPHIAPVVLTQKEMEDIVAYAASIKPKDLGAGVQSR